MTFRKQVPHINITKDGKCLKQVTNYKYLGVNLNSDSDREIEIKARIWSAVQMYHSIKGTFIGKKKSQEG